MRKFQQAAQPAGLTTAMLPILSEMGSSLWIMHTIESCCPDADADAADQPDEVSESILVSSEVLRSGRSRSWQPPRPTSSDLASASACRNAMLTESELCFVRGGLLGSGSLRLLFWPIKSGLFISDM